MLMFTTPPRSTISSPIAAMSSGVANRMAAVSIAAS